jgi:hypothetical protein
MYSTYNAVHGMAFERSIREDNISFESCNQRRRKRKEKFNKMMLK